MQVLHLDYDDLGNPWGGGQARRTYEVSRRLASWFGWDITVVTGNYPGARPVDVPVARGRLRYRRVGFGSFPWNILSFSAAAPLLARTVACDLIVEDFTTPVGPSLLPRVATSPVVGSAQFLFAPDMARKYRLPFDRAARRLLSGYRHLIALTAHAAAALAVTAPRARVHHVPQGLAAGAFIDPAEITTDGDHAVFMGRLDRDQKGLDTLITAWSHLTPSARPPLLIAGDGRDRATLRRDIDASGLSKTVRLIGRVDGAAKSDVLRRARLVVMPSRYETFGIVAIEALAQGIPLVASDLPELREVAAPGSILIPPSDARALAHAVRTVWDDASLRATLARAGRASVDGFTWDRVAIAQAHVYNRAMGERSP